MSTTLEQLHEWMASPTEDEHLEFKAARGDYSTEKLIRYCVAFANIGGGRFILGVTDKPPRKVVGTKAFDPVDGVKDTLRQRVKVSVRVEEVPHPDGRVVVFHIPPRPVGMPLEYQGQYITRVGSSTPRMTQDQLRRIFDEAMPDFSATICEGITIDDLDPAAIEDFRGRWIRKSGRSDLKDKTIEQLLSDAELTEDNGVTYAALILFGTRKAIRNHLPQSEVSFEYRSSDATGPPQQRKDFGVGFFLFYEELIKQINLRNDKQSYQDGLFMWDIYTFNESVVREAVLNAVSHRDYSYSSNIFVVQYPRRMRIDSPGGFPPGITPENILKKQYPRNRRIADAFLKCGLVERSGQGMDRIWEQCIKESKCPPDFAGTDDYQVTVTLNGEVRDPQFVRFLEKIIAQKQVSFTTEDLLVLDMIHNQIPIESDELRERLSHLVDMGAVERFGKGRGVHYTLSRAFYTQIGAKGTYTRRRGLDRETNKELLLKHIERNARTGSQLKEFRQVLPALSQDQVRWLLRELKREGRAHNIGKKRASRWYPGPSPEGNV